MQLHYCINAIIFIAAIKKSSRKLQGLTKSKLPRKKKNRFVRQSTSGTILQFSDLENFSCVVGGGRDGILFKNSRIA